VASFPGIVKERGGLVIEVNLEPTPLSSLADISIFGKTGDVLPMLVEGLG
jgi:NAD-dependent deacetylase